MRPHLLVALLLLLACTAHSTSAPPPFRAMAYNVLYNAKDVEASLDVIEEEQPDILCLRELTPGFAQAFRKRFALKYPHQALAPRKGTWGVGIASRHPLLRTRRFPERPHKLPAMEADVRLDGRRLKVVCVHLMPPVTGQRKTEGFFEMMDRNAVTRSKQGQALMERYENERAPLLLLGDMNEGRGGGALKAFATAGFLHACDGPGASCGNTWPGATTALPAVVEIDHLLGRGLTFAGARVVRAGGSDHFPVVTRFDFAPRPRPPADAPAEAR